MPEPKAEVVAACEQPGASISRVALAHGLNANLVRKSVAASSLPAWLSVSVQPFHLDSRNAGFVGPRRLYLRAYTDACRVTKVHDRYLLSLHGAIRFEHGFQELTGRRTANVVPESRSSHFQLVSLFLDGKHDLGVESLAIDPSLQ